MIRDLGSGTIQIPHKFFFLYFLIIKPNYIKIMRT